MLPEASTGLAPVKTVRCLFTRGGSADASYQAPDPGGDHFASDFIIGQVRQMWRVSTKERYVRRIWTPLFRVGRQDEQSTFHCRLSCSLSCGMLHMRGSSAARKQLQIIHTPDRLLNIYPRTSGFNRTNALALPTLQSAIPTKV